MEKSRDVWTISSLLNWTINYFKSKGIESARLDAEVLLSHVLGQKRTYLYVHFDEPMEAKELMENIVRVLDGKKARDIRVIRVGDLTILGEYFVIATGSSSTQVKMLADEVDYQLGEKGDRKTTVLPLKPLRQVRVIRGELEEVLGQACGDYATVILTDKADLDVLDMQDRIRSAFPNLLEIRRETMRRADYGRTYAVQEELDPFELCCAFLNEPDEEEKALLRDVINTVQEVMQE